MTKVAEVLADMVPTRKRLATDLQAIVGLVLPIVVARTTNLVAPMDAAHLPRLADLCAEYLGALGAHQVAMRPPTATFFGDHLFAVATRPIMTSALALVLATTAPLPAALSAEGQGI